MDKNVNDAANELLKSLSEDEVKLIFSDIVDFGSVIAKGPHCAGSGESVACGGACTNKNEKVNKSCLFYYK